MPVPDFPSLMLPAQGEMPASKVRARIALAEGLTPEDIREMLPSGRQSVFANRVGWAVTHMERAGLLKRVRRGGYLWADGIYSALLYRCPRPRRCQSEDLRSRRGRCGDGSLSHDGGPNRLGRFQALWRRVPRCHEG